MKNRIWELDALRGICVLGMVIVHLLFDLVYVFRVLHWEAPSWFSFLQNWGGCAFFLLSGICVTLGSRPVRRGLVVFGCGMLCTLVTWIMFRLDITGSSMIIRFGVLHCLGLCMLLWPAFSKCPKPVLYLLGALAVAMGLYFSTIRVQPQWLFPLGLRRFGFQSGDYFPLFPFLGFFLLGAGLGKQLYARKTTRFPKVNARNPIVCVFSWIGRQSLWIYLAHQPVLYLICMILFTR